MSVGGSMVRDDRLARLRSDLQAAAGRGLRAAVNMGRPPLIARCRPMKPLTLSQGTELNDQRRLRGDQS